LSTASAGTVRPQNRKGGVLKWDETQCWGGWAVKDCHEQSSKLGLGAPEGFRERGDVVMESNMKKTVKKWKMCQKVCSGLFETGWALTNFLLRSKRIICAAEIGPERT